MRSVVRVGEIGILAAIVCAIVLLALPAFASAQTLPKSNKYDLSFTLPTAGMSGCTVCHGDPNLVRATSEATQSLYVDTSLLQGSAHASTLCTGCHVDFAFDTPHENLKKAQSEWRDVAKAACKGCHEQQFSAVSKGAHSYAPRPGEDEKSIVAARLAKGKPGHTPLCGDCHGGHSIPTSGTAEAVAFRDKGIVVCGKCHDEAYTYRDKYHGAAYRYGAKDAPTCWDCHGTHEILPATDRRSTIYPRNLIKTCGKCHNNVDVKYVEYAKGIHSDPETAKPNPVQAAYESARNVFTRAFVALGGLF